MDVKLSYSEALQQATARLSWEQVADEAGGGKRVGKYIKGRCHRRDHHDNNPSCCYYDDGGFKCFSCGASGNMASYLVETRQLDWGGALKYLRELAGVTDDYRHKPPSRRTERKKSTPRNDNPGRRAEGLAVWGRCRNTLDRASPLYKYLVGRLPVSEGVVSGCDTYASGLIAYVEADRAKECLTDWWFGDAAGLAVCGYITPEGDLKSVEVCGLRADGRRLRRKDGSVAKYYLGARPPGTACPVWEESDGGKLIITEGPWNAWAVRFLCADRGVEWGDVRAVLAAGSVSSLVHLADYVDDWLDTYGDTQEVILIPDPDVSGNKARRAFANVADIWDLPEGRDVIDYLNGIT